MSIVAMKRKTMTICSTHSANGFHLESKQRYPHQISGMSRSGSSFRGNLPMGHGMGSRCRVRGDRVCGCTYPIIVFAPQHSFSDKVFTNTCVCKYNTVGPLETVQACPPVPQVPPKCNPATNLDTPCASDHIAMLHARMCMVQPKRINYKPMCNTT